MRMFVLSRSCHFKEGKNIPYTIGHVLASKLSAIRGVL
ncbi:hypothetical protein SAMN04488574_10437 [Bacillus sp. 71mf]|nr:hypothetical protein SAMN04488574_10437 [Bacillus sp. 71mf]SFS89627.1 hypothetical protein SAMN04488145_104329 [Bacillus sp. 103mf]